MNIKMPLEKLGVIATRLARFKYVPSLLLLIGCHSVIQSPTANWQTKSFSAVSVSEVQLDNVSTALIGRLIDYYKNNPVDSRYADLKLSAAYQRRDSGVFIYVFDILSVEDVQVVYELSANGAIVDKYLKSQWR